MRNQTAQSAQLSAQEQVNRFFNEIEYKEARQLLRHLLECAAESRSFCESLLDQELIFRVHRIEDLLEGLSQVAKPITYGATLTA